jgi:Tol biopolymer transport system component
VAPDAAANGDLLYASNLEGGWHVYALDPETGEERELTQGSRDYGSDWSPDGTRIVYDSETDSGDEIVVAGVDGSDPVSVALGKSPAWSPDGTRIAYSSDGGRLWVVSVDGSDAHPITDPGTGTGDDGESPFDWNASWSPDGRSIAYTRVVSGKFLPLPSGNSQTNVTLEELRVWSEDGTDIALTDAYAALGTVDWSPDGSTLVFTGGPTLFHEETTNGLVWPRVMTIPASGGEATPITEERERWIAGATWSPDGEWIAFQDDYETIAIVRPDGSDRREVALGHEVIGLSWGATPSAGPSGPS